MIVKDFKATRRAAVPIVAIETADQLATIGTISSCYDNIPVMSWDVIRGLVSINVLGQQVISELTQGEDSAIVTSNPAEMLSRIVYVPERSIVFMQNAHRFLGSEVVVQGIINLRDIFKGIGATLALFMPVASLPIELQNEVIILSEQLPDKEKLTEIVNNVLRDADIPETEVDIEKIVDTLTGLSAFAAEQTLATCIEKIDNKITVNMKSLWNRKCKVIEQTPGLSIYKGEEKFDSIGGVENIKNFLKKVISGKDSPRAIVFVDEIEKAFAGATTDTSGVSQDQLGSILTFMQDKEVDGVIFVGAPGAAKSAIAKAAGNEAGIPTISFDLGAMKNSLVGKSGEQTRNALKVIEAISQGKALFIATCNSITSLPPELRRRFTMGIFYFDLPDKSEREKIWEIYLKKYDVADRNFPNDDGWTGAEIKQCVKLASKLNISLIEASNYIVPVSKSASEQIENLRRLADGKFISASYKGVYRYQQQQMPSKRKFMGE